MPYPDRQVTPAAKISPALGLASGSPIVFETGRARERSLVKGTTLAFDDFAGVFVALFWNNDYSNRVVYVPSGPDYLARVEQTNATWLYCNSSDPVCATVRTDARWRQVGTLNVENWGTVFERVRP